MEENIEKLKEILKTLKKNPGRTYTKKTIKEKLEYIENINQDFIIAVEEQKNTDQVIALKIQFKNIYTNIKEFLAQHEKEFEIEQNITMAAFSLETVSKALPLFAGNYIELESFLITAELINKTLSDTAKIDFLQYIYHAKLTSNVRTAIGSYIKPESFEALKELLEKRYKTTKTIPELQNKLSTLFQGKMPVNLFKDKILYIIDNLNKLGIEELGNTASTAEKNIIIKLNNKLALDTFKKGLNEDFKSTIYASRPSTMQEASELAIELENENKATNNAILHIRKEKPRRQSQNYNRNNNTFTNYNNNRPYNNQTSNRNNYTRYNNYHNGNNNSPRNTNFSRNNNFNNNRHTNFSHNRFNNNQRRNFNNNHDYTNRNNNRYVHTIQSSGNEAGPEYITIPESQN